MNVDFRMANHAWERYWRMFRETFVPSDTSEYDPVWSDEWTVVPEEYWIVPYVGTAPLLPLPVSDFRRLFQSSARYWAEWVNPDPYRRWEDGVAAISLHDMRAVLRRARLFRVDGDARTLMTDTLRRVPAARIPAYWNPRTASAAAHSFYRRDLQNREALEALLPLLERCGDGDHAIAHRILKALAFFDD